MTMIRPRSLLVLCIAIALCSLFVPPAAAEHNNAGTVKVHDTEDEDPDERNVPHVDCEFWVEGFNMGHDSGWILFFAWPPTGDMGLVVSGEDQNWTADNATPEFHFLAGPFTLASGHYRVEVYTDAGHPGATDENPHFAKSKTFWVECEEGGVTNPPCPPGLELVATQSGAANITLSWDAVVGADVYAVYRATEDTDFELIGLVNATSFVDDEVTLHVTYEYYVTAVVDGVESEDCEIVSATAIPFFPTLAVGALALLGGVGALTYFRRRS